MENLVPDLDFRCFIKQVLAYHLNDCEIRDVPPTTLDLPTSSNKIDRQLVKLFSSALYFKSSVSCVVWQPFLKNYSSEICKNPRTYMMSVLHMCRIVRLRTDDVLEQFMSIFATVCGASRFYWKANRESFFRYTAPILIVYFESELRDSFYQEKVGWKALSKLLPSLFYLRWRDPNYKKKDTSKRESEYLADLERHVKETPYYPEVKYIVPQDVLNDERSRYLCELVIRSFFPDMMVLSTDDLERETRASNIRQAVEFWIAHEGNNKLMVLETANENDLRELQENVRSDSGRQDPPEQTADHSTSASVVSEDSIQSSSRYDAVSSTDQNNQCGQSLAAIRHGNHKNSHLAEVIVSVSRNFFAGSISTSEKSS